MKKISGVYKITNEVTGDFYIGSSKDIKARWGQHKRVSQQLRQPNSKLYQAMVQYGKDNFLFEIIEETDNLKEREQYWIEQLKPCYNNARAKGWDTERHRESRKRCCKEWYESHQTEMKARYEAHKDEQLAKYKTYYYANRDIELTKKKAYYCANRAEIMAKNKAYCNQLCLYEGETLTLSALRTRFHRQGIDHPGLEAKKYLIVK